jgi:hypothetical protein
MQDHGVSLEVDPEDLIVLYMAESCIPLKDQGHEIILQNAAAPTRKWLPVLWEQGIRENLLASLVVKSRPLGHQEGPVLLLSIYSTTHRQQGVVSST